jgi:hypothetical protein
MTEIKDENEKRELRELEGKNIAHYQTLLSAWINSRMEQDKMLITVSAGAVGLLITIITTVGVNGFWQCLFASISIFGFIVAICSCLHIFEVNAKHLEENLSSRSTDDSSKLLKRLDSLTKVSFYVGIIFAGLMTVTPFLLRTGGAIMAEKSQDSGKKTQNLNESINGIKKLSPKNLEIGKSLDGIQNLSPQNLQSQSSPTASSQASSKVSVDQSSQEGSLK